MRKMPKLYKILLLVSIVFIVLVVSKALGNYLLLFLSVFVLCFGVVSVIYGVYGICKKNIRMFDFARFVMKPLKKGESHVIYGLQYIAIGVLSSALAVVGIHNKMTIIEFLDSLYMLIV